MFITYASAYATSPSATIALFALCAHAFALTLASSAAVPPFITEYSTICSLTTAAPVVPS